MSQHNTGSTRPNVGIVNAIATPADRIRWGAIIGGLFAALATLVVLGVLGVAVGLTAADPAQPPGEGFAWGAAIWSVIAAIVAFFIGGWLAGRTAAFQGHRHGVLNGSMVWATSVALVVLLLGTGITALVGAGAQAVSGVATDAMQQDRASQDVLDRARVAAADMNGTVRVDAEQADRAATATAWITLIGMLIGLGAASLGGYVGARGAPHEHDHDGRGAGEMPAAGEHPQHYQRDREPPPPVT